MVAAAVIIHLAADGTGYIDQTQCNITVQLVDTKEGIHSLGELKYTLYIQTANHFIHLWGQIANYDSMESWTLNLFSSINLPQVIGT